MHHGIVSAVCKQVQSVDVGRLDIAYVVRVDKPANGRVVITAVQVVQACFRVVIIPTITERIQLCYAIIIQHFVRDVNTSPFPHSLAGYLPTKKSGRTGMCNRSLLLHFKFIYYIATKIYHSCRHSLWDVLPRNKIFPLSTYKILSDKNLFCHIKQIFSYALKKLSIHPEYV